MPADLTALTAKYAAALGEFLAGAEEPALARAYELGRRANEDGLGILDLGAMHRDALAGILGTVRSPEDAARMTQAAGTFFLENLAPFEMTHRGYRETNEALRKMNETLEAQVAERTQDIERQLRRLSALRTIDMAITASLDLRMTLNVFLDEVTTQLAVGGAAAVLLMNPSTRLLEYHAGRGFRTPAIQRTRLRIGQGLAGRAVLDRRTVSAPIPGAATDDAARAPMFAEEGFVGYFAAPLVAKGEVKGVLEVYLRHTMGADQHWLSFLEALAGQAAIAIDSATLFENLQRANIDLILAYDTTLEGWSRALDLRDRETEGHSLRVTDLTLQLAREMGVPEDDMIHVRRGALLHDIGKMGIPDAVLLKSGPLTEAEWEIMRRHPTYAHELLSPITYLRPALDIPYAHHEKWDGTGYPRGLKEEQIPLAARIFAAADVWDALRSDRPYRPAWPEAKARAHVREQSGTHFDPRVVDAFLALEI